MKSSVKLLSALVILVIVGIQSVSTQVLAEGEWKTIKTLTGTGDKDTEDFTVPSSYWRIVYTITTDSDYPAFYAYIYPAGETTGYVAHVSFDKAGTDTSYVRAGPRDFWIHVLAANLSSWTIEVQTQQ
jgi:hypothetical protein